MKVDLAVIGQGAVSPAGVGLDALMRNKPVPIAIASVGRPDQVWPVLRVNLKDPGLARWDREPRLRRASPMTLFLVEAAAQALTGMSPADRAQTGLIIALSVGCLAHSRRFFEGIVNQGQRSASPALFPETVFNSPGSHVAAVLGLNGAAYALVGDESAWVGALKTAAIWIKRGRVRQVLVLGAEEFDPLVLDAYRRARWLRPGAGTDGFLASEGAGGVLVRAAQAGDSALIINAFDGFIYRTKAEAADAARRLFANLDPALPCHQSADRTWLSALEKKTTGAHPAPPADSAADLGQAFNASSAWHTLRALAQLNSQQPRLLVPVWGLNHQFSSLELERRAGIT